MECFLGIDVSKATLDIASLPDPATWVVTNDDAGLTELGPTLAALHPTLIVLEATGGFESAAVAALAKFGHHPILRAFYRRLCAAGKVFKVAITACPRKLLTILNAMVRAQRPWAPRIA